MNRHSRDECRPGDGGFVEGSAWSQTRNPVAPNRHYGVGRAVSQGPVARSLAAERGRGAVVRYFGVFRLPAAPPTAVGVGTVRALLRFTAGTGAAAAGKARAAAQRKRRFNKDIIGSTGLRPV